MMLPAQTLQVASPVLVYRDSAEMAFSVTVSRITFSLDIVIFA